MKKITLKQNQGKMAKRNQLILGIILVFVMFFSVIGYSFQGAISEEKTTKLIYNNLEFINQNNLWITNFGGLDFVFNNKPNDVKKIYSNINSIESYYNEPIYIYSENSDAERVVYQNLNQVSLRMQKACPDTDISEKNFECEETLPLKNCTDNLIVIYENNFSSIEQKENCVFIKAPEKNLSMMSEAFLLKILGV